MKLREITSGYLTCTACPTDPEAWNGGDPDWPVVEFSRAKHAKLRNLICNSCFEERYVKIKVVCERCGFEGKTRRQRDRLDEAFVCRACSKSRQEK